MTRSSRSGTPTSLPRWLPAAWVAAGTLVFSWVNVGNAARMAPNWGMDLAFFEQLVASAARGGPWSTPLLLEPQGFFEMVHTHLLLPLVVGAYTLVPRQETLLVLHAFFAALALWPAARLGEACGGRALGILAPLGLLAFPPFHALGSADFRPSVLFFAAVLGIFAAARTDRLLPALAWAALAILAREDGVYLVGLSGVALSLVPWGAPPHGTWRSRAWSGLRLRIGLSLLVLAGLGFAAWVAAKPSMFHHINPLAPVAEAILPADEMARRLDFTGRLARSGAVLGLLSPAPLMGLLPIADQMATDHRGWTALTGPGAHHAAFWSPWLVAAGIGGAGRLRRVGPWLWLVLNAVSLPWVGPRDGPAELQALEAAVGPDERVAASYPTIHRFGGRPVLWNTAQLRMQADERPRGWHEDWPVPLTSVDVLVIQHDDPLAERARGGGWRIAGEAGNHQLLRPPSPPD